MRYDARTFAADSVIEMDLCVVGAGPAGLTLARELLGSGLRVAVIESGGTGWDDAYRALNDGTVVGDPYQRLRDTRHRQVGGTAHIWNSPLPDGRAGAKYVPLDPWDFEQQDDGPFAGWPFGYAALRPFYERAQTVCGLGEFRYTADSWTSAARPALALDELFFTTNVYQFGAAEVFTRQYRDELERSDDVVLCHDLTVHRFETSNRDERVTAVIGRCLDGRRVRVRADVFVLAAGAIENARLLLLTAHDRRRALGDHSGWLGRGLMEHPRDSSLTLIPRSETFLQEARFYDVHAGPGGTVVCGRIGVHRDALHALRLPNVSATLLPASYRFAGALSGTLRRLAGVLGVPMGLPSYGWSRRFTPARGRGAWRLYLNVEQRPHPDNRIVLSGARDPMGVPRVEMRWRFRDEERRGLDRLRVALVAQFERCGLGRVTIDGSARIDPNAHHHAGTTRMHRQSGYGVVDPDLRVHEIANLYVAGGSVLPSAGFANPTLTVVALSLRLADHLRSAWFKR